MPILKLSSTGPYVELMQLALQRAGFYAGDPDGLFGPATQRAVIEFQRKNRLVSDGVIGPRTRNALMPYIKGFVRHTLRRGDSLFGLAKQYGTTVQAITTANPRYTAENLPVGVKLIIPLGFDLIPTNVSYTSHLTALLAEGLAARYPFIQTSSIGNSVRGRPLWLLTMGTGPRQVSFNASHHGNEWITTPTVLRFMEDYAKAVSKGESLYGQDAAQLFARTTLFAVPLVNPDGVDVATGGLTDTAAKTAVERLAENYPEIPYPDGWKANLNGVDLNLQYPAEWEQAKVNKFAQGFRLPGPRDFVGAAPLTQPEAVAMANFTENHDFRLILAYHAQGEILYYRFADYDPPRADEIGQALSEVSGYALETTPFASGFAGYKDWFIQQYNRPGYTVEVGKGASPLPLSQFEKIYGDNAPLMTTALALA